MPLPAMRELAIGDVRIAGLVERNGPWRKPEAMLLCDPAVARRHLAAMPDFLYDAATSQMVIAYQSFVVRTPRHTVLIDTCTGEHKGYPPPLDYPKHHWLDRFHALGLDFASVDYVFCTHMHFDHTGWNTRLLDGRWTPTFPNAKYIFHKREYAFWEAAALAGENPQGNDSAVWTMNCLPIVEAGQALLVDEDFELDDCLRLALSPGHTACHCCVHLTSGGRQAVFVGDLMHHPLQCREPDWSTRFCWDPAIAAQSRRRYLEAFADRDVWLLPNHFPPPTAVRIETDGDGFACRFRDA